jgi:hypothetical protein
MDTPVTKSFASATCPDDGRLRARVRCFPAKAATAQFRRLECKRQRTAAV